jgi:hypothetical protein
MVCVEFEFWFEFGFRMSNWRILMETMDLEVSAEAELEISLAQLLDQPSEPAVSMPVAVQRPDEAGPSRPPKQPRLE